YSYLAIGRRITQPVTQYGKVQMIPSEEVPRLAALLSDASEYAVQFPSARSGKKSRQQNPSTQPIGMGTRGLFLYRFPFSIIYRDEEASVSVVAIAHHKRRPGYWKDPL